MWSVGSRRIHREVKIQLNWRDWVCDQAASGATRSRANILFLRETKYSTRKATAHHVLRTTARSTTPDHFEQGRRAVRDLPILPGDPSAGRLAKHIYTSDTSRTPTPKRSWRRRMRIIEIMTIWPKEMGWGGWVGGGAFRDQAMPRTSRGANRTHPGYHYRENKTKYIIARDINLFRNWTGVQITGWPSSLIEALWRGIRNIRPLVRRGPSIFRSSRRRRSNPPSNATRYGPREIKAPRS